MNDCAYLMNGTIHIVGFSQIWVLFSKNVANQQFSVFVILM